MGVEYRVGDLFAQTDVEALAHGCNCAGAMGAGIAVEFKRRWPAMFEEYRARCRAGLFVTGSVYGWRSLSGMRIYCLGTQEHWCMKATMPAVTDALRTLRHAMQADGVTSVALPRIGAGLGGLPWDPIREVVEREFARPDMRAVVCELSNG